MLSNLADRLDLPVPAVIAIGVVALIQIGFQIAALIDLARQPVGRIRPNKLVWVLVILFGNWLGAVLYFTLARQTPATVAEPPPAEASASRAEATADLLYGPRERR
jgi:hypothetical protein